MTQPRTRLSTIVLWSSRPLAMIALMLIGSPFAASAQVEGRDALRRALTSDWQAALDIADAALDSARIEDAVTLLDSLLSEDLVDVPADLQATAHVLLGEAVWSLGLLDSAEAEFVAAVRATPFAEANPERLNPEVLEAFRSAKRLTVVVDIRVAGDTVADPTSDAWRITIGVGYPGQIRLLLVSDQIPSSDSTVALLPVDSVAEYPMSLLTADNSPIEPGTYTLQATVNTLAGSSSTQLEFSVQRLAVDTVPHELPLDNGIFRPESRKGSSPISSVMRGLAFGAAAIAIPVIASRDELGNSLLSPGALTLGASISFAGLAGLSLGRPDVPIPENVTYNRDLIVQWERRNQAIASQNEMTRRLAPLRLTMVRSR